MRPARERGGASEVGSGSRRQAAAQLPSPPCARPHGPAPAAHTRPRGQVGRADGLAMREGGREGGRAAALPSGQGKETEGGGQGRLTAPPPWPRAAACRGRWRKTAPAAACASRAAVSQKCLLTTAFCRAGRMSAPGARGQRGALKAGVGQRPGPGRGCLLALPHSRLPARPAPAGCPSPTRLMLGVAGGRLGTSLAQQRQAAQPNKKAAACYSLRECTSLMYHRICYPLY